MRTTIRQVAEHAQVSPVTVSNILRNVKGCASEITRERVLQAMHEMNYIPVQAPVSQNRANETRIVSVVFEHSDITHHFLESETFDGLARGAYTHGYDLLVMLRPKTGWELERPNLRFLDRRSDGFIFATNLTGTWDNEIEALNEHQIPTVACYRQNVPDGVAHVNMNNAALVKRAVSHLVECGHTRIAYLAGLDTNYNAVARRNLWQEEMRNQGLADSSHLVIEAIAPVWNINYEAIKSVFTLGVTAVICFNDALAVALHQMATERGLKIPRDLSIIGVDNRPQAQMLGLTTFATSFSEIGQLAMDAWVDCAAGKAPEQCHRVAPVEFIQRDSVQIL